MIHVKVTTKTTEWTSRFNGDIKKAKEYYLGKYFDVGNYPHEQMEEVIKIIEIK